MNLNYLISRELLDPQRKVYLRRIFTPRLPRNNRRKEWSPRTLEQWENILVLLLVLSGLFIIDDFDLLK